MDALTLITFMAVATLLVISPGPNGVLIAKTVPVSGRQAGFANIFGFVAAFYAHGTLSILGLSILLVQSAQAFFIFKMLGAAYLIWIGIKALIQAWQNQTAPAAKMHNRKKRVSLRAAFLEGFLTNALNPKVSMFYLAAFPQFLTVGESALSAYVLVTAHAILNVLWFSLMVVLLSKITHYSLGPKVSRWFKSVTGVAFIGFGAKLALLRAPMND